MSRPTCASCSHMEMAATEQGPVLQCRRYPPAQVGELLPLVDDDAEYALELRRDRGEPDVTVELEMPAWPRWPEVHAHEGCGEHSTGRSAPNANTVVRLTIWCYFAAVVIYLLATVVTLT